MSDLLKAAELLERLDREASPGLVSARRSDIIKSWMIESAGNAVALVLIEGPLVADNAKRIERERGEQATRSKRGFIEESGELGASPETRTTSAAGDSRSDAGTLSTTGMSFETASSGYGAALSHESSSERSTPIPTVGVLCAGELYAHDSLQVILADSITSYLAREAESTGLRISKSAALAATHSRQTADADAALILASRPLLAPLARFLRAYGVTTITAETLDECDAALAAIEIGRAHV